MRRKFFSATTLVSALLYMLTTSCNHKPCCPFETQDPESTVPLLTSTPHQFICPGKTTTLTYGLGFKKVDDASTCEPEKSVKTIENKTEGQPPLGFQPVMNRPGVYASNPSLPLAGIDVAVNKDSTFEMHASGEDDCPTELARQTTQDVVDDGDSYLLCCDAKGEPPNVIAACSSNLFGPGVLVDKVRSESGQKNPNPATIDIGHSNVIAGNVHLGQEKPDHHGLDANGNWDLEVKGTADRIDFGRNQKQVCVRIFMFCKPTP
jgi:hypothetical protein